VPDRVLSFEVCGGLTNQRIALIQGFMLALLSRRNVVLPDLNPNGVQQADLKYEEDRSHMLDFGSFFNCQATVANLRALGIEFAPKAVESRIFQSANITSVAAVADINNPAWWEQWQKDTTWAVRLGCTFAGFNVQPPSLQQLFWSIDRALVFSSQIAAIAGSITSAMRARSMQRGAGGGFNALHLRIETDWLKHCAHWDCPQCDPPRDNCMTNTYQLHNVLRIEGVSTKSPLYIAGEETISNAALHPLLVAGHNNGNVSYDLVTKDLLLGNLAHNWKGPSRDLQAAIDFIICRNADTFIGNSVSTFSAMLLLERQFQAPHLNMLGNMRRSLRTFHYNGGSIPLAEVLFFPTKTTSSKTSASTTQMEPTSEPTSEQFLAYGHMYRKDLRSNMTAVQFKRHWVEHGKKEGRVMPPPLRQKNEQLLAYARRYPEFSTMNLTELQEHWWMYGQREGRTMPLVPTTWQLLAYARSYPDLTGRSLSDLRDHWLLYGQLEGRILPLPPTTEQLLAYRLAYPTLTSMNLTELATHWLLHGKWEGLSMPPKGRSHLDYAVQRCFAGKQSPPTSRHSLKWVFTVTNATSSYDYMVKVAVLSALANTKLLPVCIFYGEPNHMANWMEAMGVSMIYPTPKWRKRLIEGVGKAHHLGLNESSHLYNDIEMSVATFLRIDLPILGFLDEYVLYADVDVIFVGDLTLEDFGDELPAFFTMGSEATGSMDQLIDNGWGSLHKKTGQMVTVGNAGVLLLNVQGMRRTYQSFVDWLFSTENIKTGLHFGVYGPQDQGALNEFYQGRFHVTVWPLFNWKPYWGYCPTAKLIHFHGPKPNQYWAFIRNGTATEPMKDLLGKCKPSPQKPFACNASLNLIDGQGCHVYLEMFEALQQWEALGSKGRPPEEQLPEVFQQCTGSWRRPWKV
jgi:hypothetical protein